jgi:DNA-binding XRE family transcriptional regulator
MRIVDYRKHLGLTQEAFAKALGFKSKGFICDIEDSNRCSAKVALTIEAHSKGLVDAATLNDDVKAARGVAA